MLREILIHYFVRLKASEISGLAEGKKKTSGHKEYAHRRLTFGYEFYLPLVNNFANSIQNEVFMDRHNMKQSRFLFASNHIYNDIKRQLASIWTQNSLQAFNL